MSIVVTFKGGPLDGFTQSIGPVQEDGLADIVIAGPERTMYRRDHIDEAGESGVQVATYIVVPPDEDGRVTIRQDMKPDEIELSDAAVPEEHRCDAYEDTPATFGGFRRVRCDEQSVGVVFVPVGPVIASVQLCRRHFDLVPDRPS